jgi:hypothetical protein
VSEDAKDLHGLSPPDSLPDPEEHPDPDRLYAYQANELTADEDQEIQEHLAVCGHCTELLLDIQRFTAPPAQEEAGLSEFEQAAGWRQLRGRLEEDGFFTRSRRHWRQNRVAAVAAVFVLAILGLSIYSLTRRTEPERPHSLDSLNHTRGGPSEVDEVELPVRLVLKSQAAEPYPEYRAEIRELPGDRIVKKISGLRQNRAFEVDLKLGRGDLPSGEYRLDLLGLRNGRLEEIAEYGFRIPKQE